LAPLGPYQIPGLPDCEVTKIQLDLAFRETRLAWTLAKERKFSQAEDMDKRSIAILEKLAADHPQNMIIAARLANSYRQMADTLLLEGENQSGLAWSGRAIRQLRSLVGRDPRNLYVSRTQLVKALGDRAETLIRLGRNAEAVADFEEMVQLSRGVR
jgi:tetratricopeptide (TPR) repeat protein